MAQKGRPRYKSGFHEENKVYYFSVTSNGMTAEEWVSHFEKKGLDVEGYLEALIFSPEFVPTVGIVNEVAVLDSMCLGPKDKYMKDVYRVGKDRGLGSIVSIEVICLAMDFIFQYHKDEWWGINIAYGPLFNEDGDLGFLGLDLKDGDVLFCKEIGDDYDHGLFGCGLGYVFSLLK